MKYLAIALATAALTGAQTPAISIKPSPVGMEVPDGPRSVLAMTGTRTGVPILGYLVGPGPLDLRAITGTGKAARLGGPVALPSGVKHLFAPPREHYVLLESSGAEPLAVWLPAKGDAEGTPVSKAMPHPDAVCFSARGEAAVVYAKSIDRLQVISGLPGEPSVALEPGIVKFGEAASFAVSDDGGVVVAMLGDGTAISSLRGSEWQRLPAAYGASALLFVSHTHNLVVSDAGQQTLRLVSNIGEETQGAVMVAQSVSADRLAFTKEGDVLLAASLPQGRLWTVDLKTMTPGAVAVPAIEMLLPLRDGHTFLLSPSGLSLVNVPADRESAAGFVSVTR
jgi:hypothetical protein